MRQYSVLKNQVRVVSQYLKDRDSASIGVWVGSGGRYEHAHNKGVAHFIEHMAFKGSSQYNCNQIKQFIEGVGGNLNAFTGEEETCYYAKVPAKHLPISFDVLSDICIAPKISLKDLTKERTVILEEIKMYLDLPQYHVGELLQALLWPHHPLGESLAGTPETVQGMSPADLKAFHRAHYVSSNIVIAAAGQVSHEQLVQWAQKKFGGLPLFNRPDFMKAPGDQEKPRLCLHSKKTEQMHLALGYLGYHHNHPDYYALGLLSIILGGNMSSRLFHEVREKRGLAYSISCGMKSLDDTGCFMIRAGVDNAKIVPACVLILDILGKMTKGGVKPDEFKRAKEYYLGQFQLGLEDTMEHMIWLGGLILSRDRAKSHQDVIQRIQAVTAADVNRVARYMLKPQRANLAIIGPLTPQQEREIRQNIA